MKYRIAFAGLAPASLSEFSDEAIEKARKRVEKKTGPLPIDYRWSDYPSFAIERYDTARKAWVEDSAG